MKTGIIISEAGAGFVAVTGLPVGEVNASDPAFMPRSLQLNNIVGPENVGFDPNRLFQQTRHLMSKSCNREAL